MLYLDKQSVEDLLVMPELIALMRETLKAYSQKQATQVLRTAMKIATRKTLGIMPAALGTSGIAGAKIITVYPDNFEKHLPSHQGVIALFETETGMPIAIVDGQAVTGMRTAAVSAVATDALARKDAHTLAILGSGLQAYRHVAAIRLVREINEVRVWDINRESAARFAQQISRQYAIPVLDCCDDVGRAVRGADIICTVTAAKEPVLFGAQVSPGTHINAIGACSADARELDTPLVRAAHFFCDSTESVMNESGDFLIPLREGAITEQHLRGEIGAVLCGTLAGRTSDGEITIFEALGLAVEDLAAANAAVRKDAQQHD